MNTHFSRSLKNAANMLQDLAERNFDLREYLLSNSDRLMYLFIPKPFYIRRIRKGKRIHVNMKKTILDYVRIQRR
jgi:hypothetical protein